MTFLPFDSPWLSSKQSFAGSKFKLPAGIVDTVPGFCFPEGAKILPSRPWGPRATKIHTFALKESDYNAACLTFHRPRDAKSFWAAVDMARQKDDKDGR